MSVALFIIQGGNGGSRNSAMTIRLINVPNGRYHKPSAATINMADHAHEAFSKNAIMTIK